MPDRGHVADHLASLVAERESQIVLGLDPDPQRLWPAEARAGSAEARAGSAEARAGSAEAPAGSAGARAGGAEARAGSAEARAGSAEAGGATRDAESSAAFTDAARSAARAAAAVLDHCRAVIDAVAPAVVAVKPQVACFERLGAPGWATLAAVVDHARSAGLFVLADGKRGDIDVTATAYAQGFFSGGAVEGLGADALTVNPYMGLDTLRSFAAVARPANAGLFALVRTSNPGAADLMDEPLARGGTVWERVAELVAELGDEHRAPQSGLADVGAVLGATQPEHLARARELLPHTIFLLPGVGAQGGRVEDLAPAFAPGRAAGLVTASRSIVRAHETTDTTPASAARAEAERLRTAAWSLA